MSRKRRRSRRRRREGAPETGIALRIPSGAPPRIYLVRVTALDQARELGRAPFEVTVVDLGP